MVAFDLCHVLCTSIAEIKGFRFRTRKIICIRQKNIQNNEISSLRQASAENPQRPFRRSLSQK